MVHHREAWEQDMEPITPSPSILCPPLHDTLACTVTHLADAATGQHLGRDAPDAAHTDDDNCLVTDALIVLDNFHTLQRH